MGELQAKYVDDFLAIEREIEITLPKLADDIASKVDKNWENRMKGEIGSVQMKYETEIESMREEILEMHASFAERDARRRVQLACERAEIENMRSLVTSLKHTFGAEDKSFAPFKCFSASHLQNSEIDVLRKDSERRVGSEEHENEHAYVRAFSLLQAQVNTMKSELNNTMTQQTRFSSKSLTTVSHIYSDVGEDNFCGNPTFEVSPSQSNNSSSLGNSHVSMITSDLNVISPIKQVNGSNEAGSFHNLDGSLVDGKWRAGYWKSRYFLR